MLASRLVFFLLLPISTLSLNDDNDGILTNIVNGTSHYRYTDYEGPKNELSAFFYIFNGMLVALFSIAISASVLDYWETSNGRQKELNDRLGWKALMSFSIPRNTSTVLSLSKHPDSIICLDALRFISFTWIVSRHAAGFASQGRNVAQMVREANNLLSTVIFNAAPSVDTFFLISGLLVSYTFLKKVHKDPAQVHSRNYWILYYVHRWLRLTPAYMLFICLFVVWTPQLNGVFPKSVLVHDDTESQTHMVQNCEKNWWMNFLYINNFQKNYEMASEQYAFSEYHDLFSSSLLFIRGANSVNCYEISWFLSVDMQLYWIAPIFLVLLFYSWNTGAIVTISTILVSMATIAFITTQYDLPVMTFSLNRSKKDTSVYHKPWACCIPYLIGIVCGYLIVQVRTKKIELQFLKTWHHIICWVVATILALAVTFSTYEYTRGQSEWGAAVRSLYGSVHGLAWSVAVGYVVLACTFDWAGPVSSILSHPIWYPLGRLSYSAYLWHGFLIIVLFDGDDRPIHFVSMWHMYLTVTIPTVFLSCVMAFIWTCLVEIPFGKIEVIVVDYLMHRGKINRNMNIRIENGSEATANQSNTTNCQYSVTSIEVNNHNH